MKFNKEKFKEKVNEKGFKLIYVANQLDITGAGLNRKMAGYSTFKLTEIYKLVDLLDLKKEDINNIFFNQ